MIANSEENKILEIEDTKPKAVNFNILNARGEVFKLK